MSWESRIKEVESDYNSNYLRNTYIIKVSFDDRDIQITFDRHDTDSLYECYNVAKLAIQNCLKYEDYFDFGAWRSWFELIWPEGLVGRYVDIIYYDNSGIKYELDDFEELCRSMI